MNEKIYLDYAASTPPDSRVLDEMFSFYKSHWGNASAVHSHGKYLQKTLDFVRKEFLEALGAKEGEIVFTASATESNNMVLFGLEPSLGRHIVISNIEHPSIEKAADILRGRGWEITAVKADSSGFIDPADVENAIGEQTALVSIQYVNNELGTIQPIKEIGEICKEKGTLFHCDAAQGFGKLSINVEDDHIDLLSVSSQKIYGPLGVGLLYLRPSLNLKSLLVGGGQEGGRRASTVNVPGIVGFGKALTIYEREREEEKDRIYNLKNRLLDFIMSEIPNSRLNGKRDIREGAYNILNVSFKNTDNELLALHLDRQGFSVSTGSACSSGKVKVSRILKSCGIADTWARGTLRISLGRMTTEDEINQFMKILPSSIEKVRKIS